MNQKYSIDIYSYNSEYIKTAKNNNDMKILLLGEASFVHSTLRKGFEVLGHNVTLVSAGCVRNCPRDIDLSRDMRWGKLSGLKVIWQILRNIKLFVGNDIVQMNDFHTIPLKLGWNELFFKFIKRFNKKVVRGCWGDDSVVFDAQAQGILAYSDTHIGTRAINVEENKWRLEEQQLPEFVSCFQYVNKHADAFAACLYEYYVYYYNKEEYRSRLYYMSLPMEIPNAKDIRVKGTQWPIKVLVGIQTRRDYIKGAGIISELVEKIAVEHPDKVVVKKVHDVPYPEYCKMLAESDVLVDQLYSYTPSMNSLAAMARGTVVIGGGEEDYYNFIGEKELRPIINVRPCQDEYNMNVLRESLLTPGRISQLSRESVAFVRKHHDYMKVSRQYVEMYEKLLS